MAHKRPKSKCVLAAAGTLPNPVTCPNNPNLILLRNAAADERNAISLYLEAAMKTGLTELFLDVAEDEMYHYVEIMRQISRLDPVQSERFRETDLDVLTMIRPTAIKKPCIYSSEEDEPLIPLPPQRDLPTIQYLTRALDGELHAINTYQEYMNSATDPQVQNLFCRLMNDEKEHVAEFTAALFDLTHEPVLENPLNRIGLRGQIKWLVSSDFVH